MQDLNDLALFAAVVKNKGFTAAATALGVPKSKISKRVAQLEDRLGVRLLERSTRKLRVTDIGQTFYERCETILAGVDEAETIVAAAKSEPAGPIRLSMPPGFAPMMAHILPTFLKRYPQVRLAVVMTNRPVDLIEERIDVALRVRESYDGDQSVVVRKFTSTRQFLAASPSFVAAHGPIVLENLPKLPTLAIQEHTGRAVWSLMNSAGEVCDIAHIPTLSSVEFGMLERAAIEGVGIGLLPDNIVERGFRAGLLVPVLPEWSSPEQSMHAAFTSRHGMLPAVRALIDYLAEVLPRTVELCKAAIPQSPSTTDWSI
ncbi:LysR family transcriptional regulator [Rhizobium sp. TRM96647]|uniref:LysR family transcriptional regulator n=1 Tax=unclassified Rhizobium TaxID=2613769 RepID=UPI0021E989CA|nr:MULTISPECIES: LysR family transcriptional regulator [unclassified Rhizobium]MCV3737921.1 LysR family transcriptional regulator [Rhizobium sp. TRM96647]MCV3759349.1 LysR family transcriptional regulator [Rhizobium sp. TRM96650]